MTEPTHKYVHPEGKALGRHHADAEGRDRFDPDKAAQRGLTPGEIATLAEKQAQMDALDMPDGTLVHHDLTQHDGQERVEWTDGLGQFRATGIAPDFFASHFVKLDGAPETPTLRSVQEHEFERGDYERPPWRPKLVTVTVPATGTEGTEV